MPSESDGIKYLSQRINFNYCTFLFKGVRHVEIGLA